MRFQLVYIFPTLIHVFVRGSRSLATAVFHLFHITILQHSISIAKRSSIHLSLQGYIKIYIHVWIFVFFSLSLTDSYIYVIIQSVIHVLFD